MVASILDGKAIAAAVRQRVSRRVAERASARRPRPGLAVILVGDDPASAIYVRAKHADCIEVGMHCEVHRLDASITPEALGERIDTLNTDPDVHGIILQLPLPAHLDDAGFIERIAPEKDVDGYHPYNVGRLALRQPVLRSGTPKGIMTLLDHTGTPIRGRDALVIGASNHVGRPMGLELLLAGCTVTTAHKFTRDLADHVRRAEILVSATGRPGLVRGDWVREGSIVIDVGMHRLPSGKLTGDVEFDAARERAAWITPVPGGVGPMTRASILENTLEAADRIAP